MLLISNNAQKYMAIADDAVLRINMAWIRNKTDLVALLNGTSTREVFLDYPEGRNKPPKPILTMEDAYEMCKKYPNIKYFAVSNVESVERVLDIQSHLPKGIQFVPKIETLRGIKNFGHLVYSCEIKTAMLDKEDLYLDVKKDNDEFYKCVEHIKSICVGLKVNLLELQAVVFTTKT